MTTYSEKRTQSLHHGWSSVSVDRLDALLRSGQVCVPLASLLGILAKPDATVGSPGGCSGDTGRAPAVAAILCLPRKVPKGRVVSWVDPMLSSRLLWVGEVWEWHWVPGPSFLWPLLLQTPVHRGHPSPCQFKETWF